ncbi:putative transcriptional regulatory protein C1F7.11c [Fusarium austroafricanum]|uniref:Putative transcriptional regulatory protein C1F7.11c n=1 Tax=Fusarium austroafricanum TaxID=2364996 RepID=A0A8H4KPT9_9HYPO|nr:putative transcriptional regulatory protein C1F7.11c [Fusarium austroafricanum]
MADQEARPPEWGPERVSTSNDAAHQPRVTTQDRIRHLESLVFDLMQHSSVNVTHSRASPSPRGLAHASESSPAAPDQDPNEEPATSVSPADYGSMQSTGGGGGANYVGSAHWAAVLDGIAELKDHFDNEEASHPDTQANADDPPCAEITAPQLLYGCTKPADKDEILASVPARPVVDRLISRYFNSFEMSPAVLHSGQFLNEYEGFWEDPAATSPIWLGLLFTIMCLATQFEKFRLDPGAQSPAALSMERDLQQTADTFRLRVSQCLALGSYTKGGPYVLETLMLYIAAEIFNKNDAETEVWILMGNTVQLALHMGYHRDPKHFKGMSPFVAEMRRRVWATIVEMDIGISTQMGLPRMIKQWQTDTQEPSNLQDNDFSTATVELPQSRPESDLTPILYRLVKARMMRTAGYVWDFSADVRPYPYSEVERMDKKLDEARKSIPDCLVWYSIARCITDSPQVIMQKVLLETLFYRAKIVLHRKHMFFPLTKTANSRRIVLESALKLLDYQHMLQEETQPFCQLYQERWRVSSLVNHDFLLATSILCYYVQHARGETLQLPELSSMNETIMTSLKRSYDIWLQSSNTSKEARKVVRALAVVLGCGNASSTDSGIDSAMSLGFPSAHASPNFNNYRTDVPMGLGSQFPILDSALMPNWATFADDLISAPMATPSSEWQAMDGAVDAVTKL